MKYLNHHLKRSMPSLLFIFLLYQFLSISVYAEIIINKDRIFVTNNNTQLKVDDVVVDSNQFLQKSKGMIAEVSIGDDVDATVTSGTATAINAENQIKGPVTNILPLQVLGQDIVIDADTILDNTNGIFSQGELLLISGEFTDNNILLASRVQSVANLEDFKLISQMSNINGNIAQFGKLSLDLTGVNIDDCGASLQVGQLVEFSTVAVANFDVNNILSNISEFECKSGLISIPIGNNSSTVQFSAEGFISAIIDPTHFNLNGQQVEINNTTKVINGTLEDIDVGVKLEAEGTFNVNTNLLIASELKFTKVRVRIIAPVTISNLTAEQIVALNISGELNALSKDPDNIRPALLQDTQIEIKGFLDGQENLLVDKIRNLGTANANDVRLRGPVSNVNNPAFQILGVNIDVTGGSFVVNGLAVSSSSFFAGLAAGAEVDINHGVYDSLSNTLTGGTITLEEAANVDAKGGAAPAKATNPPGNYFIQADGLGALGKGRIFKFIPSTGVLPVAIVNSSNVTAEEGSLITLDGSNSTGTTLSYLWQQMSGPAVVLQNSTSAISTFTAPQVNANTSLSFDLVVTDDIGNTNTITVTVNVTDKIIVTPPPPPTSSSGGGGSMSLYLFGLLSALVLLRRRTRHLLNFSRT